MEKNLTDLMSNITHELKAEAKENQTVLTISGGIGKPDFFMPDLISAKQVKNALADATGDIVVKLNSPGGDVFQGIEIYNLLKDMPNKVIVEVTALAASIASVIAMAGDEIVMCQGAQVMVHRPSTVTFGNIDDHLTACELLEKANESMLDIYETRTGRKREDLKAMLEKTTWMTADEAIANGFANTKKDNKDEIIAELKKQLEAKSQIEVKNEVPAKTGIFKFIKENK